MLEPIPEIDYQNKYSFFEKRWFRYLLRILILYIFSTIFKSFDLSFVRNFSVFGFRGQVFSLLYVIYGLLVWKGALWITKFMEAKLTTRNSTVRLISINFALLIYGIVISFFFGFYYGVTDIVFFHKYEAWESFISFSYDLIFGTFLFYLMILAFNGIFFYYRAWKEYQMKAERLRRENIQAKYEALRNQIEPHFFFNSLSVLTNLVYKNPDLAAEYIVQLAKTYRYILDKKFEYLVPLQTELDFLDSYLYLIKIRHDNSIQLNIDINEKALQTGMIPPATLQMLIENAIKHNRFSVNQPLEISIKSDENILTVKNMLNKKVPDQFSTGTGLENIRKRYELSCNENIVVKEEDGYFIVQIPIICRDESRYI